MTLYTKDPVTGWHAAGPACLENGDLCTSRRDDHVVAHLPGVPEPLVRREVRLLGARGMRRAFPDFGMDVASSSSTGPPASGSASAVSRSAAWRVEGGEIAEEWVAPDLAGLVRQVSAPPAGP